MPSVRKTRLRLQRTLSLVGSVSLLASLLPAGCKKPIAEAPPSPLPEPPAAAPSPTTPPPATPPPAPRVAEATPAPDYLAPAGVFFLVASASVETAAGITGLRPGTPLQQTGPGEYTAPGGHKLTLRPDQVTNDLRIARHVAGADVAAQNALRQLPAPRAPQPATVATPPPPTARSSPPAARTSAPPAASRALGAAHTRVKDGYVWEKDRTGTWVRIRPVRP